MADTDPVLWGDLKQYCREKQINCRALADQTEKTNSVSIETALKAMAEQIEDLKRLLDGKLWVIQRPIFILICIGMIGVGVAGEKIITLAAKYFGG